MLLLKYFGQSEEKEPAIEDHYSVTIQDIERHDWKRFFLVARCFALEQNRQKIFLMQNYILKENLYENPKNWILMRYLNNESSLLIYKNIFKHQNIDTHSKFQHAFCSLFLLLFPLFIRYQNFLYLLYYAYTVLFVNIWSNIIDISNISNITS